MIGRRAGSGEGGGAVDDLAADHGQLDGEVREVVEGEGQRVLGEDDEIGELAWRDRAFPIFLKVIRRRPGSSRAGPPRG